MKPRSTLHVYKHIKLSTSGVSASNGISSLLHFTCQGPYFFCTSSAPLLLQLHALFFTSSGANCSTRVVSQKEQPVQKHLTFGFNTSDNKMNRRRSIYTATTEAAAAAARPVFIHHWSRPCRRKKGLLGHGVYSTVWSLPPFNHAYLSVSSIILQVLQSHYKVLVPPKENKMGKKMRKIQGSAHQSIKVYTDKF